MGIRGSMPGDKHAHDKMYMAFRLQYMDPTNKHWVDLASAKSPSYLYVGPGNAVRQGGRSFQLVPRAGKPSSTLRGRRRLPVAARQDGAPVGEPRDLRAAQEPCRRGPDGIQRGQLPDLVKSRGSLVMIPSTPRAVRRSIVRRSSTVQT